MSANDYAIIELSGHQYQVSTGDKITVDRQPYSPGEQVQLSPVLLLKKGEDLKIGQPILENTSILATVVANTKGDKLHVFKYKAKSRYKKSIGFRPHQTTLQILSLDTTKREKASKPTTPDKVARAPKKASKSTK